MSAPVVRFNPPNANMGGLIQLALQQQQQRQAQERNAVEQRSNLLLSAAANPDIDIQALANGFDGPVPGEILSSALQIQKAAKKQAAAAQAKERRTDPGLTEQATGLAALNRGAQLEGTDQARAALQSRLQGLVNRFGLASPEMQQMLASSVAQSDVSGANLRTTLDAERRAEQRAIRAEGRAERRAATAAGRQAEAKAQDFALIRQEVEDGASQSGIRFRSKAAPERLASLSQQKKTYIDPIFGLTVRGSDTDRRSAETRASLFDRINELDRAAKQFAEETGGKPFIGNLEDAKRKLGVPADEFFATYQAIRSDVLALVAISRGGRQLSDFELTMTEKLFPEAAELVVDSRGGLSRGAAARLVQLRKSVTSLYSRSLGRDYRRDDVLRGLNAVGGSSAPASSEDSAADAALGFGAP